MNNLAYQQQTQILKLHDDIDDLMNKIDHTNVYRLRYQKDHERLSNKFTYLKSEDIQQHLNELVALKAELYQNIPQIEFNHSTRMEDHSDDGFDFDSNF